VLPKPTSPNRLGQDALGSWPIAVLAAALGVEAESAARTVPQGLAQLITVRKTTARWAWSKSGSEGPMPGPGW
jgi:hypothetical protein